MFPKKVKFLSIYNNLLIYLLLCTLNPNSFLTNLKILQKYETHFSLELADLSRSLTY